MDTERTPQEIREAFTSAVEGGNHRTILLATRDLIAVDMADPELTARDLAALTARFTDVLGEIAALPAPSEGTPLDELAQRRGSTGGVAPRQARSRRG